MNSSLPKHLAQLAENDNFEFKYKCRHSASLRSGSRLSGFLSTLNPTLLVEYQFSFVLPLHVSTTQPHANAWDNTTLIRNYVNIS